MIRKVEIDDLPELVELWREGMENMPEVEREEIDETYMVERFQRMLRLEEVGAWVACSDRIDAIYSAILAANPTCAKPFLACFQFYRRKGSKTREIPALLEAAAEWGWEYGAEKMQIATNSGLPAEVEERLWRRHGFERVGGVYSKRT